MIRVGGGWSVSERASQEGHSDNKNSVLLLDGPVNVLYVHVNVQFNHSSTYYPLAIYM